MYGDELVTKIYLNEALSRQSQDLNKEFYEALNKQSEEFNNEIDRLDRKIDEKSEILDRKINETATRLDRKIDEKFEIFDKKIEDTKKSLSDRIDRLDRKLEAIGGRWGLSSEKAITKFAEDFVKSWRSEVRKLESSAVVKVGDFEDRRE